MNRRDLISLFCLGLALRLGGLFFNGMADLYQILLEWGAHVVRDGLVDAFSTNYGIFSYGLFGIATRIADLIPRFWWAPYKLIILSFDIAVLVTLLGIASADDRRRALVFFWLNPWFILHEAYHGFWEAPHILFGLLAVRAAIGIERAEWRWSAIGALLACSAMFKPQGLLHFLAPMGLYLLVQAVRSSIVHRPSSIVGRDGLGAADVWRVVWYVAGAASVVVGLSLAILVAGGSFFALVENYRTAMTVMAGISNGGPGIWRFLAFAYMVATGQQQTIPFVKMPRLVIASASGFAALVTLGLQIWFGLKVRMRETTARERGVVVLAVLAFASLVMSQFGVRAHINHSYGAMVLLIPFALSDRYFRTLWIAMNSLLAVSHALVFGLGHAALLLPEHLFSRYPAAAELIARVTALPAYEHPDWPLRVQLWVADVVRVVPGETIVSLLSIVVFGLACLMAARMITLLRFDRP